MMSALTLACALPSVALAGEAGATSSFGTWLSILPPVLAIALAVVTRNVTVALLGAIFSGSMLLAGGNPFDAFARTISHFIVGSLADRDHASILIFSALLGAMVGCVAKSGGTHGMVDWIAGRATSRKRGQLAAWWMGLAIFFDDYANTLLVGSTMRPITDRLRISREKLAYIVDSTAAPIASLIPLSTWIGFEIGLIQGAFDDLGLDRPAIGAVVASIPYRFYQVFALALGFLVAFSLRDFGPMRAAEQRAQDTGKVVGDRDEPLVDVDESKLSPPEGKPLRPSLAIVPILTVVFVVILGLFVTGSASTDTAGLGTIAALREIFSAANSYDALLWASMAGFLMAAGLAVGTRVLTLNESVNAGLDGIRSMMTAFVVLVLSWALGAVCTDLGTAEFLVGVTGDSLPVGLLPTITLLTAVAVAFSTGTSWGTMGILTPLVIPLAHALLIQRGLTPGEPGYSSVFLGTIASVLAGAVWGDHCSPISDTTILSSMASACDHLAHVRTQLPYSVTAGAVAIFLGTLPSGFGISPWICWLLAFAALFGVIRLLGRPLDQPAH